MRFSFREMSRWKDAPGSGDGLSVGAYVLGDWEGPHRHHYKDRVKDSIWHINISQLPVYSRGFYGNNVARCVNCRAAVLQSYPQ